MPIIDGQDPPPQAVQLCRWIAVTDWANSFSVFVEDSLQREELETIGKESKFAVGTVIIDRLVLELEVATNGTDAETE